MLVKLLKLNSNNHHIEVEEVETGKRHELTCPVVIFVRTKAWGIGTIMEVETFNDVVKNIVRRDPLDERGTYA